MDSELTGLYNRGMDYFHDGDITEAVNCFRQVVEIDQNYSPAWNNLGVAAFRKNLFKEAGIFFEKACFTNPENTGAAANLADLFFSTKQYMKAEQLYTFLSEKHPQNAAYFARKGDCSIVFAEYNTAHACYRRAAELEPDNEESRKRLQITACALAPIPFAVSRAAAGSPPKAGLGAGLEYLAAPLENAGFEVIPVNEAFSGADYYFNPLEITLVQNDASFYSQEVPALCRMLILDTVPETAGMTVAERSCNIDFVVCPTEELRKALVEKHDFAEYQTVAPETGMRQAQNDSEGTVRLFRKFLAEMTLFYAQRLEYRDCHEQEYWLMEKAVRILPDFPDIEQRYRKSENKINHLLDRDAYRKLYDESADLTGALADITSLKRYEWLKNRLRVLSEGSSLADIGCHKGEFCFALAEEGYSMTGIDIAERNIREAQASIDRRSGLDGRLAFYTAAADRVDTLFPADQFDGAILMEILEHVPDVDAVLNAVDHIVKPGGQIFVTVPFTHLEMIYNVLFRKVREYPEHVRRFNPDNIPVYFRGKKELVWEEIIAESRADKQKWLGISYRVE